MSEITQNGNTLVLQVVAHFCMDGEPISYRRIIALTYLADWFSALATGSTITALQWEMGHSGPEATGLSSLLRHPNFLTKEEGGWPSRRLITYLGDNINQSIDQSKLSVLEFVTEKTQNLYFSELVDLVYSTYPVVAPNRHRLLDLPKIALEYHHSANRATSQNAVEHKLSMSASLSR